MDCEEHRYGRPTNYDTPAAVKRQALSAGPAPKESRSGSAITRPAARGPRPTPPGCRRFSSGARLPICPRDVCPPQNKGCRPTPPWLTAPAAVFPVPRCAWTSRRWQPSQAVKPQLRRCGSDGPDVCGHDPDAGGADETVRARTLAMADMTACLSSPQAHLTCLVGHAATPKLYEDYAAPEVRRREQALRLGECRSGWARDASEANAAVPQALQRASPAEPETV